MMGGVTQSIAATVCAAYKPDFVAYVARSSGTFAKQPQVYRPVLVRLISDR